jgi:histone H2A
MKEGRLAEQISTKAAITMAAVLEFLAAEVLELASEGVDEGQKQLIIKPRHISIGIRGDEELARLVGDNVIIPTGGVIPYIHPELEVKPKRKKKPSKRTAKPNQVEGS